MSNQQPIKLHAGNPSSLLKRKSGSASLVTSPVNVRSALMISLALTRVHSLPTPDLHVKSYLPTPTYGGKQGRNTQTALSQNILTDSLLCHCWIPFIN